MIPTVAVFCPVLEPRGAIVHVTSHFVRLDINWVPWVLLPPNMSFPYNTGDGSGAAGSGFPHWETLQHSPLDTPVPTPSSGTFHFGYGPNGFECGSFSFSAATTNYG